MLRRVPLAVTSYAIKRRRKSAAPLIPGIAPAPPSKEPSTAPPSTPPAETPAATPNPQ